MLRNTECSNACSNGVWIRGNTVVSRVKPQAPELRKRRTRSPDWAMKRTLNRRSHNEVRLGPTHQGFEFPWGHHKTAGQRLVWADLVPRFVARTSLSRIAAEQDRSSEGVSALLWCLGIPVARNDLGSPWILQSATLQFGGLGHKLQQCGVGRQR